jgi:HAD superfamily hydrolase (TIGR01509 family)
MPPIEAVFFDLGDTISDLREGLDDYTQRVNRRAARVYDTLAEAGVSLPDRDAFAAALGHFTETRYQAAQSELRSLVIYEAMREFCRESGIPASESLVLAAGDAYCLGVGAPTSLRLGARETLDALRASGYRLGVISNSIQPGRFMDASLVRYGLFDHFAARIYSSEAGVPKPHPAIFREALAALGVPPERAAHVGDRLVADVAGAQGVGMRGILIEVAHRPEQDDGVVHDARIRELPELLGVLPLLAA